MQTFPATWTPHLGRAIKALSHHDFALEFHHNSADYRTFAEAINQGIDAHLEAVLFTQDAGTGGRVKFTVNRASLGTLIRRLMESGDDNAASLASSICSMLGIELI